MISNNLLKALINAIDDPEFDCPQNADDDGCWKKCVKDALLELKERRESDLRPAMKFVDLPLGKHIEKIHEEFDEVLIAALEDDEEHLREKLVDLQMTCETALTRTGLDEAGRRSERKKNRAKNAEKGYYDE